MAGKTQPMSLAESSSISMPSFRCLGTRGLSFVSEDISLNYIFSLPTESSWVVTSHC